MQILCQFSQEGLEKGIGVFDQKIKKFENISTPHMGWNNIKIIKKDPLLKDVPNNSEFYFLHSYFLETKNDENTLCLSKYSKNFSSIIKRNNIYGIQFHPEKSHKLGEKLLLNFYEL